MVDGLIDTLLVVMVLLNFLMLGVSRIGTIIRAAAAQGALLGTLSIIGASEIHLGHLVVGALAILIKGFGIPILLFRAIKEVQIRREVEPFVGFVPSLLLGGVGTGLAVLFAASLGDSGEPARRFIMPASFSTILTGFLILTTRLKAITQVVGYLVLENGILLFGLLLIDALPLLVEMGGLLDLFVAVFAMGIILNHIRRAFSSLDTKHLTTLKE